MLGSVAGLSAFSNEISGTLLKTCVQFGVNQSVGEIFREKMKLK
jgi:hypothetical protein